MCVCNALHATVSRLERSLEPFQLPFQAPSDVRDGTGGLEVSMFFMSLPA